MMLRYIVGAGVALLMIGFVAGCGESADGEIKQSEQAKAADVKVQQGMMEFMQSKNTKKHK